MINFKTKSSIKCCITPDTFIVWFFSNTTFSTNNAPFGGINFLFCWCNIIRKTSFNWSEWIIIRTRSTPLSIIFSVFSIFFNNLRNSNDVNLPPFFLCNIWALNTQELTRWIHIFLYHVFNLLRSIGYEFIIWSDRSTPPIILL